MSRPRRGSSLIELLVVLAIISVLLGLLLSAVQQVRATAARLHCLSKLRQLALALHVRHDTHARFPPGLSLAAEQGRYPYVGWPAFLLPYLEQSALSARINDAFSFDPNPMDLYSCPQQQALLGVPLTVLACPADPRVPGPALIGVPICFTSYLGVQGTNQSSRDGLLYLDSAVRLTDVTDGTSHTLLLGERPPSADQRFGWWYRGWGQQKEGSAEMVLGVRERNTIGGRYPCPPGPYHFTVGRPDNQCDMFHFWSQHPGGAGFAFADGSVRFLTYGADRVFPALATRAGGEVAPAD